MFGIHFWLLFFMANVVLHANALQIIPWLSFGLQYLAYPSLRTDNRLPG